MPGAASFPSYLARRFVLLVFTMVLVPSLSFVMFTLIQGVTEPLDVLRELATYLSATFLHADFGGTHFQTQTYNRTRDALEVVEQGFLVDAFLIAGAIALGVLIGLLAGAVQATHPRTPAARTIAVVTVFGLSVPVYWLALVLLLLFAPGLGSVAEIPFLSTINDYHDPLHDPPGFLRGLWLPALIVATPLAAACTRMSESQLLGTLHEDFVRTARGKGVARRGVIWRHALPAAAAPVVTLVGVNMNVMLTNVALVEVVFNIPGAFRYIEDALKNNDVDLVQALVFEATFFIVMANFVVDAIHAWLDPRIRTSEPR